MEASSWIILVGSGLLVASILTSVAAMRLGTPLLLIFLGVGLLAGQDGLGGIPFDDPDIAFLIGSAALAVILFESGFDTRLQSYRAAAWPALTLATLGVAITTAGLGTAAHFLLGLDWLESFLLGAVCSSTDAAAVFFLLRVGGITIRERVRSALEIESGTNDPMAILLTIVLVEAIRAGGAAEPLDIAVIFVKQLGIGALGGLIGGVLLVASINAARLDTALNPVVSLAGALFIFAGTAMLEGSGFLAVYLAGLVAGNAKLRGAQWLRRFHSGLTWLSQIVMFVMLGLLATPTRFVEVLTPALALGALLILVGRPIAVWLCLSPFRFSANETTFIAWVGLRGAVSLLLALVPILGNVESGEILFNTAFVIVLVSLIVQGWTIKPMARWLGLIVPPRTGPVERVELELPDDVDHELVAYTVHPSSPVANGQRLPRWARPALVLRADAVVPSHRVQPLHADDHVYMFVARRRLPLYDKLFAAARELDEDDRDFFGDLVLNPATTVEQLAEMYGLPLAMANASSTLAEMLEREFGAGGEPGDRLRMGPVELILRERDEDGNILSVGLALEPSEAARPKVAVFDRPRALLSRISDRWHQLAFRFWRFRQRRGGGGGE